jgi:hypothetical protein
MPVCVEQHRGLRLKLTLGLGCDAQALRPDSRRDEGKDRERGVAFRAGQMSSIAGGRPNSLRSAVAFGKKLWRDALEARLLK